MGGPSFALLARRVPAARGGRDDFLCLDSRERVLFRRSAGRLVQWKLGQIAVDPVSDEWRDHEAVEAVEAVGREELEPDPFSQRQSGFVAVPGSSEKRDEFPGAARVTEREESGEIADGQRSFLVEFAHDGRGRGFVAFGAAAEQAPVIGPCDGGQVVTEAEQEFAPAVGDDGD